MLRGCADSPEIAVRHTAHPQLDLHCGLASPHGCCGAPVFFTERLVHSTVPWMGKGERRKNGETFFRFGSRAHQSCPGSLFVKYAPHGMHCKPAPTPAVVHTRAPSRA